MFRKFPIMIVMAFSSFLFAATNPETNLKIITFNVRYGTANDGPDSWENRKSIFLKTLKKHNADIIGTQESLEFQIDFIKKSASKWNSFGVGRYFGVAEPERPHESMKGESCNILFDSTKFELIKHGTFWHSDTPEVPGSRTWGNDLPRITTWGILQNCENGKQFAVMNTHYHWNEPYVTNTTKLNIQKWQEYIGQIPTIFIGDFNLDPASQTHELLCSRIVIANIYSNFKDCWQVLNKPESEAATSHGFKGTKSQKRIDWILVTPEFKVNKMEIIYDNEEGRYPSDHYPVMVDLRLE